MRTGTLISGAAHAALIAAAVFGLPWLTPRDSEPPGAVSVSFISGKDFEAAQAAANQPEAPEPAVVLPPEEVTEPELPVVEPEITQPPAAPDTEIASLSQQVSPEAPLQVPSRELTPVAPVRAAPEPPSAVTAPRPRPVERIEAIAALPPPEESVRAETPVPETAPQPDTSSEAPEQPAAAPPEASPDPVTEPSPPEPLALEASVRPIARPRTQAAEAPAPDDRQSQIGALVAAATPATTPEEPAVTAPAGEAARGLSAGSQVSAGEREAFLLKVQSCWNVPAELRDAGELTVVIGLELDQGGNVLQGSIRLLEPNPVPDARFRIAFEAGRRALIRCQPYDGFAAENFANWRAIEAVFNPEGMVAW